MDALDAATGTKTFMTSEAERICYLEDSSGFSPSDSGSDNEDLCDEMERDGMTKHPFWRLRAGSDMYNNQFNFNLKQRIVDRAAGCGTYNQIETENKGYRVLQSKDQQIPCPPPCPTLPPPGPIPGCCPAPEPKGNCPVSADIEYVSHRKFRVAGKTGVGESDVFENEQRDSRKVTIPPTICCPTCPPPPCGPCMPCPCPPCVPVGAYGPCGPPCGPCQPPSCGPYGPWGFCSR